MLFIIIIILYFKWSVAMMENNHRKQNTLNSKTPFPDDGAVRGFALLTHY